MKLFSILGVLGLILLVLIYASGLLIPVVIALFLWHLILAVADGAGHIFRLQRVPSIFFSILCVTVFFFFPINLALYNLPDVLESSMHYQQKIDTLSVRLLEEFSISKQDILTQLKAYINIPNLVSLFAKTLATFTANFILILLYVAFLLYDQRFFNHKLNKMFPLETNRNAIRKVFNSVNEKIKTYLWVKTLLAILGGVVSYIFFRGVGLPFSEFWAVMIFFLGYIPTIGAIFGVVLPALLCLVEFDTLYPFLIVSLGCGTTHFFIGNVLEPKLLGDSMNLSAFVILFSLILWSFLWGVIGAFLATPITVIILIVCSEFERGRPVAIALSAKGNISLS